jgi:hypothetical protein
VFLRFGAGFRRQEPSASVSLLEAFFLKPVVDLIAAIESRRKASIELQRTKNDSHEHLRTIGALESALSEAKATIVTRDSRLREVGLRRYIIGACVGLLLGGAAAAAFYFRIPPPVPPTPTAKYAEGYALGYSDGLVENAGWNLDSGLEIEHDPCWRVVARVFLPTRPSVNTAVHEPDRQIR